MDEEGQFDQPDTFDLELELVRWVKVEYFNIYEITK